jgi:hypothetical protein
MLGAPSGDGPGEAVFRSMDRPGARRASSDRGVAGAIFLLLFAVYAWFHPGGGWSQNVRFAQVRALVEQGRLEIDDYLLYAFERDAAGAPAYRRVALSEPGARSERLPRVSSLDLSLFGGHYYPNKPPGITLLAAPVYAALHAAEQARGVDPDDWWVLTLNLYLTRVLAVGALGALGGALFHACSRRLFPGLGAGLHAGAALAFGLGTLALPYATLFGDAVVVASLLLLVFRLLLALPRGARAPAPRGGALLFAAGSAGGLAVLVNNSALLAVAALGVYAAWRCRPRGLVVAYLAGGVLPAALLAAYQQACFGSAFDLPQRHQLEVFQTAAASPLLGVFAAPDWSVLPELLFRPYRGLFLFSPVLVLGVVGLGSMLAGRGRRAEAALFAAIFVLFVLMNLSFNGWHGGSSFGPRYLIPALPFLALPLAPAFARFRLASWALASLSVVSMGVVTAVGPQVEVTLRRPATEYYLPLLLGRSVEIGPFTVRGPVSAHPMGATGGDLEIADPDTRYAAWNSFNLGELLFPRSWTSLVPLLLGGGAGALALLRRAGRAPPVVDSPGDPW